MPDFTIDEALAGLFILREDFLSLLAAWRRKKNAILQGPPGVVLGGDPKPASRRHLKTGQ